MHLIEDIKQRGFDMYSPTPHVICRTFEDNKSCIEIATNHRTRPRTKHLSVRLHHFRHHVIKKTITIEHISTKEQIADIFTKPLPRDQFIKLATRLMSWPSDSVTRECENMTSSVKEAKREKRVINRSNGGKQAKPAPGH